ncbi:hypothetical protein FHX79_112593 [Streptomyces cavourensis]|nr:hypothetical protein FHX79_112593 [Streptomyces cavourensis]GGU77868.1 hypothetical protein GCM10010498_39790 [Streptomyces cavourensis]
MVQVGRTRAQAADVPLDDEAGAGVDDEEADDFVSEPVEVDDEDEPESDDFEVDEAGVLLDEEPRLSFR